MSKADTGHAALDPERVEVAELEALPDDEARIRFVRAAIDHCRGQAETLSAQAGELARRYDEVVEAWAGKVDEAIALRDGMENELARWESRLAELGG